MQEIALFSGKIYTAGTNFTHPSVVTVATNLNSVREYILNTNGVSEGKDPYCPTLPQSAGCRVVGHQLGKRKYFQSFLIYYFLKLCIFTKVVLTSSDK